MLHVVMVVGGPYEIPKALTLTLYVQIQHFQYRLITKKKKKKKLRNLHIAAENSFSVIPNLIL